MDQSEVKINIIHAAVGGITETDVTLAAASDAIIIGFNVRPTGKTREVATREKVDIRLYRVIYQAIEDINAARVGLLSPDIVEEDTGIAEVRETFKVPKVGVVAGCYIVEGEISRDDSVRIVRDGTVVYEGEIESLRRFKDDVKSVARGYECGIGIAGYQDIKIGRPHRRLSCGRGRENGIIMKQSSSNRRVNEQAREVISEILLFEISDPRLDMVTITGVEVSYDRSVANVYYSTEPSRYTEVAQAFNAAAGRIRSLMAKKLSWRVAPELRFHLDESVDNAQRIAEALSADAARNANASAEDPAEG